ncbi:MAG: phytanoyl-CoA dioxygenase family protein [Ilumatobacter sp.]|nr:phytanoyl-CoA dioxygenase family protein [Ilumatobacter sp.]MDG2438728.1 phytanoyl-CoA dioxygenase family protein [Ilumatobacter sp.]
MIPTEFDPSDIASKSSFDKQMYRAEVATAEPMKSVLENNPNICFVPPKSRSDWGNWDYQPGAYYDTTVGSKHPEWQGQDLPQPTVDISRLRQDLVTWGYCKVAQAVAPEQVAIIRKRVLDQAGGERRARIAQWTQSGQNINCCVNKGRCFEGIIEQDPEVVQGGPLIEQLLTEALGANWICNSLIAAIAEKGGVPQALHQDQSDIPEARSPILVNVLTAVTDLNEITGGTLLVPGSHRVLSDAMRTGQPVGKLPPAINLDAPAGSMVLIDGRLLHGTGINHADEPRIVLLNAMQKPWKRQQENWMLSVRPEVLGRASPKLLQRMGFQAATGEQTNEGHGFGARGRVGEAAGSLAPFRHAADSGVYLRVGELGTDSTDDELQAPYTLRSVVAQARSDGQRAPLGIGGAGLLDASGGD